MVKVSVLGRLYSESFQKTTGNQRRRSNTNAFRAVEAKKDREGERAARTEAACIGGDAIAVEVGKE